MLVSAVTEDTLEHCWNALKGEIAIALEHGHGDLTSLDEVYKSLKDKTFFMWVIHEGEQIYAGVIFSIQEARKRTLWVEILAGRDMDLWLDDAERILREYKDVIGADCVGASCRVGLVKKLKNWEVKAISMELKL